MKNNVEIKFRAYNGLAGEDELHIAEASDGRMEHRLVGHSRLARWFSRRILIWKIVGQYKKELKQSLYWYELTIHRSA